MKEGSFEGLMSGLDFSALSQNDIQNIKTPDHLPEKVNLADVPESVLRSTVIESLISQNDDLMARLTVSLRRISQIEEKCADSQTEAARFRAKYDNLKDQVLVLKEQARILNTRTRETSEKQMREVHSVSDLKEQVQLLEIRYAELYNAGQKRFGDLEDELATAQDLTKQAQAAGEKITRRYGKYRQKLKPALAQLKQKMAILTERKLQQDTTLNELRKNVSDLTTYVAEQGKQNKIEISHLTSAYEVEIRGLRNEITTLTEQNTKLHERSAQMDDLYKEKVRLENDLIIAARREEEVAIQHDTEVSDIQKAMGRYRNEAKELAIELESVQKDFTKTCAENEAMVTERAALTEQVETLQLLWREQQTQIEKLNEQKNSLQKLNQELSISINEYRRDLRDSKEKLESEVIRAQEVVRSRECEARARLATKTIIKTTLAEATEALVAENSAAPTVTEAENSTNLKSAEPVLRKDQVSPDLIAKIDQALSRLHIGH